MERCNGGIGFLVRREVEDLGGNEGWQRVSRRKPKRKESGREEAAG